MQKRFEMVMVPNEPKELKPGMLCRSFADDADENIYYFLDETSDLTPEGLHQSVIPFIVSKDKVSDFEKETLYLFRFEDGGCCVAYPNEVCDLNDVLSAQEVAVSPEQIGVMRADGFGSEEKTDISIEVINQIMSKEGWCYVDIDDEFTAPEKFTHVAWGESVPEIVLHNGKCVISA